MSLTLRDYIELGDLPVEAEEILPLISNTDGTYLHQEGEHWDFKETWPFSYSDSYFGGLARLICAFINTNGGVIIFGVDDKTRKGGRTKTVPNVDRLEQAFSQLTRYKAHFILRRYENAELGSVDILLVMPKLDQELPVRFSTPIAKYPADALWVRRASQVFQAEAEDVPMLYLGGQSASLGLQAPLGQLPPSPLRISEFVGRMSTIDAIFDWLIQQDEPRSFLYGKGGSGKSTIAFQVFKYLRTEGHTFRLNKEDILQQVIFISAKQNYLNIETQKSEKFVGNDFQNEAELYSAILTLGGAGLPEDQSSLSELKDAIRTFLDENTCFIVIDDIDTLTTAGMESGMDFLHGALWRAKRRSKVLYTLRNRPSHSLKSAIEVPGLIGDAYIEFVGVCAKEFRVPVPEANFRDGTLLSVSEGRPLVVESIVWLRKHSGSYDAAMTLFDKVSGDDIRRYVFEREWNALEGSDRGREILSLIAHYGKPIAFTDVCTISKMDESKVKDAIAAIQENFLITDNTGHEALFKLGDLTRSFVLQASASLDYIGTITARVEKFQHTFYGSSPEINRIAERLHRAVYYSKLGDMQRINDLWRELDSGHFSPSVSEDPRFLSLRGYVALLHEPQYLDRARRDFDTAFQFKFDPDISFVKAWFEAERRSDTGDQQTKRILEYVMSSRGYDQAVRTDFKFQRASFLYGVARSVGDLEPERSLNRMFEALELHLQAFKEFTKLRSLSVRRSEEYTRNTAFSASQFSNHTRDPDRFSKFVARVADEGRVFLDPLIEPIMRHFQMLIRSQSQSRPDLQKLSGRLDAIAKAVSNPGAWCMDDRRKEMLENLESERLKIKQSIQRLSLR